jgi:Ca-activated chloride channel family protein
MGDFSFLAPWRLLLLTVPIALLVAYVVMQRRRTRYAMRFTNVELLDSVAPDKPGWRRHIAAIGLLTGLVVASMAAARPAFATEESDHASIVMLAIDTSLSMQATDVAPTRLAAAQNAARAFLAKVPKGVKVGLVGFDGQASLLVPPTDQIAAVEQGINNLQLGEGTAIGEAVFTSLDALDQALQAKPASTSTDGSTSGSGSTGTSGSSGSSTTSKNNAGAIVLMSDGETTMGRSNDEAAAQATKEGRPVYTIAVGTDSGTVTLPDGSSQAVPVNRDALQQLAQDTGGHYFPAYTSAELKQVYQDLGRKLTHEHRNPDVSGWFVGGAMGLLALAAVGSLLWFARLP